MEGSMMRPGVHWIETVADKELSTKNPAALAAAQQIEPACSSVDLYRTEGGMGCQIQGIPNGTPPERVKEIAAAAIAAAVT